VVDLLVSPVNPSVYAQPVALTYFVTGAAPGGGTPTGQVTFKDGTTNIGMVTLSGPRATLVISTLAPGTHSISVSYPGDTNFKAATFNTVTQSVNKDKTVTTVVSSENPSTVGQSVTFTALVNPLPQGAGTPTGTGTFKDGATSLGTGTLQANANGFGSTATFTTSTLTAGTHSITAVYGGDTNDQGSTSAVLTQTVNTSSGLFVGLRSPTPAAGAGAGEPWDVGVGFWVSSSASSGAWVDGQDGWGSEEAFLLGSTSSTEEPAPDGAGLAGLDQFFEWAVGDAGGLRDDEPPVQNLAAGCHARRDGQ
jgi:hypothetical protein